MGTMGVQNLTNSLGFLRKMLKNFGNQVMTEYQELQLRMRNLLKKVACIVDRNPIFQIQTSIFEFRYIFFVLIHLQHNLPFSLAKNRGLVGNLGIPPKKKILVRKFGGYP